MSSPLRIVAVVAGVFLAGSAVFALFDAGSAEVPQDTILATVESTTTSSSSTTTSTSTVSTLTTTTVPAKGTLVIQGTGDVNLDPDYIPAFATNGYDYAWAALDGIFESDDLTVINLECAPSDLGVAESKEFVFRCPTESLASLAGAGIEAANMGNNHSGDYGKEALIDGRSQLSSAGVAPPIRHDCSSTPDRQLPFQSMPWATS